MYATFRVWEYVALQNEVILSFRDLEQTLRRLGVLFIVSCVCNMWSFYGRVYVCDGVNLCWSLKVFM